MARLSDEDLKVILGPDYVEREVTEERRADLNAAKRVSTRNTIIGFAILVAIVLAAVFYGGGR